MTSDATDPISELEDQPFDLKELFYSRTDKRGVILAGNSVFQKISGFEWPELIGSPHKIVRNFDTPRSVFRIMWDRMKRDEPVVAYVRNKTKDGRGYWVIATIMPLEDGYISVRLKPTSDFFEKIKPIYAELSKAERTDGITVEDSEARLMAHIQGLGFADYQSFSMYALGQEFRHRSLNLNPRMKGYFADIDRIRAAIQDIFDYQRDLLTQIATLRGLPTNMRIIASRLEPSGGPLTAMSDIYSATSISLFGEINDFASGSANIVKTGLQSFENANIAKLASMFQAEIENSSAQDKLADVGFDAAAEIDIIHALRMQLDAQEKAAMQAAQRSSAALNSASYDLRRSMLGLDTIRVMGLVESGRLGAEGSRIAATMEQIGESHDRIIRLLQKIKDSAAAINSGIVNLQMHFNQRKAMAAH